MLLLFDCLILLLDHRIAAPHFLLQQGDPIHAFLQTRLQLPKLYIPNLLLALYHLEVGFLIMILDAEIFEGLG